MFFSLSILLKRICKDKKKMVNPISHKKFIKESLSESPWKDIPPNFGIIKGLHLELIEFPHKIKKNAPNIPDPTYSGKAYEDPEPTQPPPDEGRPADGSQIFDSAKDEESEIFERSGTASDDNEEEFGVDELNFLDTFGATPQKKEEAQINWEEEEEEKVEKKIPKFVNIEVPQTNEKEEEEEKELDPTEIYIKEEVERLSNIKDLKKLALKGLDIGGEVSDSMDLQTSRIRLITAKKQVSAERSISMNKFGLMGLFLAIDQGSAMMTQSLKGYFQYQMEIIDIYDELLEEIGETQLNTLIQEFDPTIKLGGMVALTTAGFWVFQNYVAEDKVKGAALLKQFLTANQRDVLDKMTEASKNRKKEKDMEDDTKSKKKKRRGPSFTADDVNAM